MSVIMFTNKNSGKNLRDKRRIYHLRKLMGDDGQVFATTSVEHLEELVADLYNDMNPSKVIIDGGDSTHCTVVEKIYRHWPSDKELPSFGLIPGGTWNLLSKQCKVKKPRKYIEDIVRGREDRLFYQGIDLMKISDDTGVEKYGFSFGIGAPVKLLEEAYKRKQWKGVRVAMIIGNVLLKGKYYKKFAQEIPLKVNAGLNGNSKDYSGSYAGIMANTIESVGKLPLIKPMTMFYRAQKLPGYFHLLAGSKKAIDDLWAYGIPLGWGKELPQSVVPIDAQTNSAYIYSEQKLNFQINGDLTHNENGKIVPYCANEFHVEYGLTIKIIQSK